MSDVNLAVFGVLAGIINAVALIPYVIDILRGNTKPERATWWVWLTLAIVSLFAQFAGGAKWSLLFAISSTICVGLIAVLSLRYGYGRFHRRDTLALIATAIGVSLALWFRSPLLAVLTVILVDLVGASLTYHKTWYAPRTENKLAWILAIIAGVFAVLAVGDYEPAVYLPPLSTTLVNIGVVFIIYYRIPRVKVEPQDI